MKEIYKPQTAIFAAGCFWGVQFYFDQVPGVIETVVGYTGGETDDPSYEEVCNRDTGHAEAVRIVFNPQKVGYDTLLKHFFRMHNPTQLNRQGPDIGTQYRSAIFPQTDKQMEQAEKAIAELRQKTGKNIVTTVEAAENFWQAEDYHQKFTERTGRGMCHVEYAPL